MRSGEFNGRTPRNVVGGGARGSGSEFNSAKIPERRPAPEQYASSKVEETKRFSETRDTRSKDRGGRSASSDSKSNRSAKQAQKMTQNVVRNAVVMVTGTTTVLANTVMPEIKDTFYEVFEIEPPAIVETQNADGGGAGQSQESSAS